MRVIGIAGGIVHLPKESKKKAVVHFVDAGQVTQLYQKEIILQAKPMVGPRQ